MTKLNELLGKDLAGYKLVEGRLVQLDHQLMGYFPIIFSDERQPAAFVDEEVLAVAKARLEDRRSKTDVVAFLLEPGGKGGFVLNGDGKDTLQHIRVGVYTKEDLDAHTPIEWAPGLL